jgi:hypothetical protein
MLGWTLWILGTPFIQKVVAKSIEASSNGEVKLLKNVNPELGFRGLRLRSGDEIKAFMKTAAGELSQAGVKSMQRNIWIGFASMMATIGLLGIVEPYLAIQWTKRRGVTGL